MADPLTAASIVTLIFTTAVGKATESLTEDARKQLGQKLQALKQLLSDKLHGRAKAAFVRAEKSSESDIEAVKTHLDVEMSKDADFAQQIQELAKEIQQIINIDQVQGQNVQNVFGGAGNQVNAPEGPVIMGGSEITININNHH